MWSKLIVDMKALSVSKEPLDADLQQLGGRSLVAHYVLHNVDPQCDPLGAKNQLVLATTLFAGTKFTTAHRLSVGGKSPLTGGIKESNAGGYAAALLAEHGIRLIVVKDQPERKGLWLLHLDSKGQFSLQDAGEYAGLNNYEFVEKMHSRFGNKLATVSIGSAGERLYKVASLQVSEYGSGHPSRAAARGGLGALMGSKRLKAIIIEKPEQRFEVTYADKAKFDEICLKLNKIIAEGAKGNPFHNIGTIATIEATGANGVLPVDNFSGKLFPQYTEVGATKFMTNLAQHGGRNKVPCQPGCLLQCSNNYNGPDGKYLTSGLEYETVALFGPNCHISDLDAIAKMDRRCDDMGVDTIDVADAMAVCMDAGKLPWGDADGVLALLGEMADGTEFGRLLGQGCEATGKSLGCKHIPVVKHQAISGYDPRNTKGTGVTYSTSPMGADHTCGLTMGLMPDDCGRAAQAGISTILQIVMAFADSLMCIMPTVHLFPNSLGLLAELLAAQYGGEANPDRLAMLGVVTLMTEKAFNQLAGMTPKDDRLPEFFYNERSVATGSKFDIIDHELATVFDL